MDHRIRSDPDGLASTPGERVPVTRTSVLVRAMLLLLLGGLVATACGSTKGEPLDSVGTTSTSLESTVSVTSEVPADEPASPVTQSPPPADQDVGAPASDGARPPVSSRPPAPEFPAGLDWLNTGYPLSLEALRGKIVLLDFWTYGCINCIHVIPDLERLEEEFADELVVIGVHSAKFEQESGTENIRRVVLRYGVKHPVVNDAGFDIWRSFGVNAWPTAYLIDPGGGAVGYHDGEGVYQVVQPVIVDLISEFDEVIDRTPLRQKLEREGLPETVLSFPGKVIAGPDGRLFIADTNHNRIVETDLNGEVRAVYGTGDATYVDGPAGVAGFDKPQGMALGPGGSVLYVADTDNHAVRSVDLETGAVTTTAGTGERAWPPQTGEATSTPLASPWDLELDGDLLYIAMAGTHQIWSLDLAGGTVGPYAGSGREGVLNGPGAEAEMAQPSGLSLARDGRLFFADSESSAIRWVDTTSEERTVGIAAGGDADLFSFGDTDGTGTEARFQHPLGVATVGETVFVADTYNSRIRAIDLATGEVTTRWGSEAGWLDGDAPLFFEPGGIDAFDDRLYVADTNNHSVRVIDLGAGAVSTLVISGIQAFMPNPGDDAYRGAVVEIDPLLVGPGPGTLFLEVVLPTGYKVNPDAPSSFSWSSDGGGVVLAPDASETVIGPSLPRSVAVTFVEGEATVIADLSIVYCEVEAESICLFDQVRLVAPVHVSKAGPATATLTHRIVLPDLV